MTKLAKRLARRTLLLGGAGLALVGCTPAGLLNGVSRLSGDGGVRTRGARRGLWSADPARSSMSRFPPGRRGGLLPVVDLLLRRRLGRWATAAIMASPVAPSPRRGSSRSSPITGWCREVRFPAFVQDGALAVKWARDNVARYGGDPARISLAGHSAGAYQAAMLGPRPAYLAAAGVDPTIIRGAALLSRPRPISTRSPKRAAATRSAHGRNPRETQPINFARADAPPMLLMHGTADTIVRPYNSERLTAKLTALGAPVDAPPLSRQEPHRPRQVALADLPRQHPGTGRQRRLLAPR